LILEASDAEAARSKPVGAPLVVLDSIKIQILRAIKFDNEFVRKANKINHVSTDCRLASKLSAIYRYRLLARIQLSSGPNIRS